MSLKIEILRRGNVGVEIFWKAVILKIFGLGYS
jgi:hypothetical protein